MLKQSNAKNLDDQSQEQVEITLQDIEVSSIEQLFAQPIPAFKETLKKCLAANSKEIARLANLNNKILQCLERIDQHDQEQEKTSGLIDDQRNSSKVSLISSMVLRVIFSKKMQVLLTND
jgi:hypothetical protein